MLLMIIIINVLRSEIGYSNIYVLVRKMYVNNMVNGMAVRYWEIATHTHICDKRASAHSPCRRPGKYVRIYMY